VNRNWQIAICAGGFAAVAALMMYSPLFNTTSSVLSVGSTSSADADSTPEHQTSAEQPDVIRSAKSENLNTTPHAQDPVHQETALEADLMWLPDKQLEKLKRLKVRFSLSSHLVTRPVQPLIPSVRNGKISLSHST
jgi:hypothetical protein